MTAKKQKKIKQVVVKEAFTSKFIFLIPTILAITTLIYGIGMHKLNAFLSLSLTAFYYIYPITNFYKRKLVITNNKVYSYFLGKKKYSCHYITDFYMIKFEQDRLGKIFNYGSLLIVDQNKKVFTYHFLDNVASISETIIITYENYLSLKNPDYVRRYVKESNIEDIDSLTVDNTIDTNENNNKSN